MREDTVDDRRGHRSRVKQKFLTSGIDAFMDHEVLEILLTYAIPRKDVKSLAKSLLNQFGSLRGVVDAEIGDLMKTPGIGEHTAILVKLIKALSTVYLRQKARAKPQIACTSELLDYCRAAMGGKKDEEFCVIFLDAQNQIIDFETVQKGVANQAVVYPRQVLERALRQKASAIILAHNHPSGHVRPSEADIRLTKTIQETARMLDILVHDHIIIGEDRFFSFREEGLMP
jgi:DNA repair protein RadC